MKAVLPLVARGASSLSGVTSGVISGVMSDLCGSSLPVGETEGAAGGATLKVPDSPFAPTTLPLESVIGSPPSMILSRIVFADLWPTTFKTFSAAVPTPGTDTLPAGNCPIFVRVARSPSCSLDTSVLPANFAAATCP